MSLKTTKTTTAYACRHPDGYYVIVSSDSRRVCNAIYGRDNVHPGVFTWDEPARCIACGRRATVSGEDADFCKRCWKLEGQE